MDMSKDELKEIVSETIKESKKTKWDKRMENPKFAKDVVFWLGYGLLLCLIFSMMMYYTAVLLDNSQESLKAIVHEQVGDINLLLSHYDCQGLKGLMGSDFSYKATLRDLILIKC